jgi:heme exporter protein D
MLERIIADYGFYMGWSFAVTAVLMVFEPILLSIQRKAVIQRLRRMVRGRKAAEDVK